MIRHYKEVERPGELGRLSAGGNNLFAFGEAIRLLRPKAYLILNTHRNPRSIAALLNAAAGGGDQGMDLHYSRLRRLLRTCGFEVVSSRPVGVWMFRNKFLLAADFESTRAQRLESIFRHPIFTPIAPDAVIVARRLG